MSEGKCHPVVVLSQLAQLTTMFNLIPEEPCKHNLRLVLIISFKLWSAWQLNSEANFCIMPAAGVEFAIGISMLGDCCLRAGQGVCVWAVLEFNRVYPYLEQIWLWKVRLERCLSRASCARSMQEVTGLGPQIALSGNIVSIQEHALACRSAAGGAGRVAEPGSVLWVQIVPVREIEGCGCMGVPSGFDEKPKGVVERVIGARQ
eukprot:100908-Pelagomonas_calceolata.AAC.8